MQVALHEKDLKGHHHIGSVANEQARCQIHSSTCITKFFQYMATCFCHSQFISYNIFITPLTISRTSWESISLQDECKDRVISYAVKEAERGRRAPNLDVICSSRVECGSFYDAIESRHFDNVASGHYARLLLDESTGHKKQLRDPDPVKDERYFLCALSQQQLQKVLVPVGHLQKTDVRELAEELDLPKKKRQDSPKRSEDWIPSFPHAQTHLTIFCASPFSNIHSALSASSKTPSIFIKVGLIEVPSCRSRA